MKRTAVIIVAIVILMLLSGAAFVVDETEQVVLTRFGKPIRQPITEAGIQFKMPFIDTVNTFEKRWLEWDGDDNQITTRDKKYIGIDTYARWRIQDPLKFFQTMGNERGAQSRLDDIIDGETRVAAARYNLIELVRTSNREMDLSTSGGSEEVSESEFRVEIGRAEISRIILEKVSQIVPAYGIELVDFRIKRLNYVPDVEIKVFQRMISERKRIAEQYRSEGQGKRAEIVGRTQKELEKIRSEAYRTAEEIKGKADGEATRIYADVYSRDPDFYKFLKNLEAMKKTVSEKNTLVISTDSEFYEILKGYK